MVSLYVPEQPEKKKYSSRISLKQLINNSTEMPVSRSFISLLSEWLEGAISDMVVWAEDNANAKPSRGFQRNICIGGS